MGRIIAPLLLGIPVLALLLWLGFWQLDRAAEKRALADAYAAALAAAPREVATADELLAAPRFAPVTAAGRYVPGRQALLDAQTHEGRAGYRVWTPLALADGGDWVLVDRGWVPAGPDRTARPDLAVGDMRRQVTGLRAPLPRPGLRLGAPDAEQGAWPRRLVWPDEAALARTWGRPLPAALILLAPGEPDGFVRDWDPVAMPAERHVGYAVQWFSLAAALVVIALVLLIRIRRRDD